MLAAGVPGRALYLKEKAWAKRARATSAKVCLEVRVGLARESRQ